MVTSRQRFKDGKLQGGETIDEQIAKHEVRAGRGEISLTKGKEEAKQAYARTAAGENVLEQTHMLDMAKKPRSLL